MISLGLKAAPVVPESQVQVTQLQPVSIPSEISKPEPDPEKVIQASDNTEA